MKKTYIGGIGMHTLLMALLALADERVLSRVFTGERLRGTRAGGGRDERYQ